MLKNNKVNVRYGPSFESPIKFIYKKINLPLKQIDKNKEARTKKYKKGIVSDSLDSLRYLRKFKSAKTAR